MTISTPLVIDYVLTSDVNAAILSTKAVVLLKDKWQPYGEISVIQFRGKENSIAQPLYTQAFVKYWESEE